MSRPVVLLTDFGAGSAYVGEVKGVLSRLAPQTPVLDLSHEVRAQGVAEGAFLLGACWRHFPRRSVFVAVVDPGVGSEREALCLETAAATFLAPDNGLLTHVWWDLVARETVPRTSGGVKRETYGRPAPWRLRAITNRRLFLPDLSPTFHGRDLFAPVAARLTRGFPVSLLGPPRSTPILLPASQPERRQDGLRCHVLLVDRFGNLVTDARADQLPPAPLSVTIAGHTIAGLSETFARAEGLLAFVDSWGMLEVAWRDDSAAQRLGAGVGTPLLVRSLAALPPAPLKE